MKYLLSLLLLVSMSQNLFCASVSEVAEEANVEIDQKKKIVKELVDIIFSQESIAEALQTTVDEMIKINKACSIELSDSLTDMLKVAMNDMQAKILANENLKKFGAVFDKYFTLDELQEYLIFLKSPLGKKLNKISTSMLVDLNSVMIPCVTEIMEMVKEKLNKGKNS